MSLHWNDELTSILFDADMQKNISRGHGTVSDVSRVEHVQNIFLILFVYSCPCR